MGRFQLEFPWDMASNLPWTWMWVVADLKRIVPREFLAQRGEK
jgi:hypothetical protein